MRWKFATHPQRSNGIAFIDCPIDRATSFAVIKTRTAKIKSRQYTYRQFVSRHQTRTQAEGEVLSQERNQAGPVRRYSLGKRMEKLA